MGAVLSASASSPIPNVRSRTGITLMRMPAPNTIQMIPAARTDAGNMGEVGVGDEVGPAVMRLVLAKPRHKTAIGRRYLSGIFRPLTDLIPTRGRTAMK